MKMVELHHIDGIKGVFGVHDNKYYMASANVLRKGKIFPDKPIVSNVRVIVQQPQIFDLLWDKVLPAKQRIREIELRLQREFINAIRDPVEIIDTILDILVTAISSVEILFSSDRVFNYLNDLVIFEKLLSMQTGRNIEIRALVIVNEKENLTQETNLDNLPIST